MKAIEWKPKYWEAEIGDVLLAVYEFEGEYAWAVYDQEALRKADSAPTLAEAREKAVQAAMELQGEVEG